MRDELKLENIRSALIRLEETIIFSLIERAQFGKNPIIYKNGGISVKEFDGSFMMFLLCGTEKLHALVRRYTAPDEHPFTKDLPEPILSSAGNDCPIRKNNININEKILYAYIENIIPVICDKEDDGNYGSSAVNDINALQAISKRVHYGKYVAEAKFLAGEREYSLLIKNRDEKAIMKKLTDSAVEEKLLERVQLKAATYGQEPNVKNSLHKIPPDVIKKIYAEYIIPFTKEVELLYLLERLK
jgi:chorismate mutase